MYSKMGFYFQPLLCNKSAPYFQRIWNLSVNTLKIAKAIPTSSIKNPVKTVVSPIELKLCSALSHSVAM